MIQAWRIVHEDYLSTAFTGEGARRTGGRWNSEGVAMIYTAGSLSLALLEVIVHLEIKNTLRYFKAIPVRFNSDQVEIISTDRLPFSWIAHPPCFTTKQIGDDWIQTGRSAGLCVPSVVVPNESNYLFNPQHPDFSTLIIGTPIDLPIDPRVFSKLH